MLWPFKIQERPFYSEVIIILWCSCPGWQAALINTQHIWRCCDIRCHMCWYRVCYLHPINKVVSLTRTVRVGRMSEIFFYYQGRTGGWGAQDASRSKGAHRPPAGAILIWRCSICRGVSLPPPPPRCLSTLQNVCNDSPMFKMTPEKIVKTSQKYIADPPPPFLWVSHKSSNEGILFRRVCTECADTQRLGGMGSVVSASSFLGGIWGGSSPPQTPPNNEEGTLLLKLIPSVGKGPTFCHWSPLYQQILDPSLTVSTRRSGEIKR